MAQETLRIGDAVTRDKNNSQSPLYRIIEINENMLTLVKLAPYYSKIELHKDQVELVTPYPNYI